MATSLSEVEKQACMLSPEDRARLAESLLESLRDGALSEIEAAWQREIDVRAGAYDRGEAKTYSAEEVFAAAQRITG